MKEIHWFTKTNSITHSNPKLTLFQEQTYNPSQREKVALKRLGVRGSEHAASPCSLRRCSWVNRWKVGFLFWLSIIYDAKSDCLPRKFFAPCVISYRVKTSGIEYDLCTRRIEVWNQGFSPCPYGGTPPVDRLDRPKDCPYFFLRRLLSSHSYPHNHSERSIV